MEKTMFIIEAESARAFHTCILGSGETEKEAWQDAYGPKPWTPYIRKCARKAWARELSEADYEATMANHEW